jgi:hypothetical protein
MPGKKGFPTVGLLKEPMMLAIITLEATMLAGLALVFWSS